MAKRVGLKGNAMKSNPRTKLMCRRSHGPISSKSLVIIRMYGHDVSMSPSLSRMKLNSLLRVFGEPCDLIHLISWRLSAASHLLFNDLMPVIAAHEMGTHAPSNEPNGYRKLLRCSRLHGSKIVPQDLQGISPIDVGI